VGDEINRERLAFIDKELGLSTPAAYLLPGIQQCLTDILRQANLLPVTLSNFIQAYIILIDGCRAKGIDLEFEKP